MANPTVSASLNKSTYTPGETMTLTVTYGDADNTTGTVTVVVRDAANNESAPVTVSYVINDALTLTVTDPAKTFTQVSNNGSVAVYTAVA